MNRQINKLMILVSLLISSCVTNGVQSNDEVEGTEIVEVEVAKRYGVPIESYSLQEHEILSGQTMGNIMSAHGKSALDIDRLDRVSKSIFPLRQMRAGNRYVTFIAQDTLGVDRLDYIAYEQDRLNYVLFSFVGDSIAVSTGVKPSLLVRNKRSAVIESSMWGAMMEQNLPYSLAAELESAYQWSIDFFGIQKGDSFTVLYDERFVDDSVSVGIGQIWGAKFTHGNKSYYAIPFKQGRNIEFWDESGGSLRKQMLKAPLKYSRISSRFSNARLHPIYKVYRPHHGVDYAAPTGTPVHSVADGVVTFKGWSGGGGNTLKIKHPNHFTTGYLHLSRFATGISVGSQVSQGQLIGYVGSTGDSTGPHLDYRIWKGTTPIDPLKVPQEPSVPISDENRESFERVKLAIIAEIDGDVEDDAKITTVAELEPIVEPRDSIAMSLNTVDLE